MRIAYVGAGAARMYCGSCLHDNALVAALQRLGHDAVLIPTYTPLRTDEAGVAVDRLFFGAVNVFFKQLAPAVAGASTRLERLLDRRWLIALASRLGGATDPSGLAPLTLSILRGEEGRQAGELARLIAWLLDDLRPDLVHLTNSMFAGFAAPLKAALGVPVVCSLQGEELFLDGLAEPGRSQVRAELGRRAGLIDRFVAPHDAYADFMADYLKVPRHRIQVVPLGINLAGYQEPPRPAAASGVARPVVVGYLARIAPEKGLHLLARALRRVVAEAGPEAVRLEVAGYLPPAQRGYLRSIERQLADWGLAGLYRYAGELTREQKLAFLAGLDLLAAPSPYADPKALYVLEALASGVPVVAPRHGAFVELLGATGGGLLVAAGSDKALASGILQLVRDPAQRRSLGQAGRAVVHERFDDRTMAAATAALYQDCLAGGGQGAAA